MPQSWLEQRGRGLDGVVAKAADGPYLPGERAMLKVKQQRTADCVVGGFRYRTGSREVGSLLLGLYNADGKLDHVGFTSMIRNTERAALTAGSKLWGSAGLYRQGARRSEPLEHRAVGEWQPVKPELVVEVGYDQVTGDRFRHGTQADPLSSGQGSAVVHAGTDRAQA